MSNRWMRRAARMAARDRPRPGYCIGSRQVLRRSRRYSVAPRTQRSLMMDSRPAVVPLVAVDGVSRETSCWESLPRLSSCRHPRSRWLVRRSCAVDRARPGEHGGRQSTRLLRRSRSGGQRFTWNGLLEAPAPQLLPAPAEQVATAAALALLIARDLRRHGDRQSTRLLRRSRSGAQRFT